MGLFNVKPGASQFRPTRDALLLVILCAMIALVQTFYVGSQSIYSANVVEKREMMHYAILNNQPPEGGWYRSGAHSLNVRILSVYAAEAVSNLSGLSLHAVYMLFDIASLFMTLLLLSIFLGKWYVTEYQLIAVLYVGTILPMTYAFHYFHPWDRPGLLLWLLFAWTVREDRYVAALFLGVAAVLNKYDGIVLPALYFLSHISVSNFRSVLLKSIGLFLATFGTYLTLRSFIGGGFVERDILAAAMRNLDQLVSNNVLYPPLLAFLLPVSLATIGWRHADQFSKASFLFAALVLAGPLFFLTQFEELRAEMAILLLMIPVALNGLQRICGQKARRSHNPAAG